MAGQSVNFFSPQTMIAPDLTIQEQQLQRQQALIDALRQQSLQPIDGGKGAISWTQGLAKLGDAIAGRVMQTRADKQATALNQAYASRLGGMFGQPRYGGGANADGTMSLQPKGGDPVSPPSLDMGGAAPSNPALPSSPAQQPPPPQSQPAAGPSPQGYVRGPLSISDNPQADMMEFAGSPDSYWAARNAQNAPADFTKLLQQSGIDPNSALGHQLMQAQVAKQNHMPLENARGGSWSTDPATGQKTYNPTLPEGSEPLFDASGNVRAIRTLDGVTQSIADVAHAKAAGTASGQAPYELITVTDPATGKTSQIPKSLVPGIGGGQGGAPGGSLNGYYGHSAPTPGGGIPTGPGGVGVQTGIGPGDIAANAQGGTNSANGFNTAIQSGVDAKNAMRAIQNIQTAASGLPTGTGSGAISEIKSGVNAVVGAFGGGPVFDRAQIAKFDEMQKNAATLGSQLASSAAGSNGVTDARLTNALHALPGSHYSPQANQEVALNLKGLQAGALGRAQAAAAWQQQHGANSYPAFQQTWQQAYNPDIYYYMQKGPQAFAKWAGSMSPTDRQRTLGQYRALKALGGI